MKNERAINGRVSQKKESKMSFGDWMKIRPWLKNIFLKTKKKNNSTLIGVKFK